MDLRDLLPVLTAPGPFVTVHVESESSVEQAADKYEMEWKNVLRELGRRGVDGATLEAIAAAKGEHSEGASRLVVASTANSTVQLAVSLPAVPARPLVDVSPLPHLLPLVDDVTERVPYVLVVADRTGAEVTGYVAADEPTGGTTVAGTPTVERSPADGNYRFLQHQFLAEQGWIGHLAKDIVAKIGAFSDRVHPEVVIGVGDIRELTAIRDHLPPALQPLWTEVAGGRGQDGSEPLVQQRVRDLLSRHVVHKTLDLLEDYAQERGQAKRACDGVEDVVAALRKAQVQTLLVTTAADQTATLWFGPDPLAVALTAAELRDLGVEEPTEGPLVDVLLRAAIGSGADVQVVPHELEQSPRGGVGAVLRYADSDTGAAAG
ncbi:MAG: hypothetical protein JWN88_906 [Frankiales bacterium]|nr:hypothetical protein [Frankiales bacterium]